MTTGTLDARIMALVANPGSKSAWAEYASLCRAETMINWAAAADKYVDAPSDAARLAMLQAKTTKLPETDAIGGELVVVMAYAVEKLADRQGYLFSAIAAIATRAKDEPAATVLSLVAGSLQGLVDWGDVLRSRAPALTPPARRTETVRIEIVDRELGSNEEAVHFVVTEAPRPPAPTAPAPSGPINPFERRG